MFRVRRVVVAVSAVFLLALVLSAAAVAMNETTGPGTRMDIYVFITDQKISLAMYSISNYASDNTQYLAQFPVRGDIATFIVTNRGKKPHNFALLGKKTPTLKPGAKAHFVLSFVRRGSFPYASAVNETKGLKGILTVH